MGPLMLPQYADYFQQENIPHTVSVFRCTISRRNEKQTCWRAPSFPCVFSVDPLRYLWDQPHQQTSETEQSENRECDSPLKTVGSGCQSQSQANSRWQTRLVSWNHNTDVLILAKPQPSVALCELQVLSDRLPASRLHHMRLYLCVVFE